MNQLSTFSFESSSVRVVTGADGEPWFVGKDIASTLGYSNPQKAIRDHCKYPRPVGVNESFTHRLDPQTVIVNEPDMLRLIVSSQLPSAEKFEKWVFEEVLPSIRKTGSYVHSGPMSPEQSEVIRKGMEDRFGPLFSGPVAAASRVPVLAESVRGLLGKRAAQVMLRAWLFSQHPGIQKVMESMKSSVSVEARQIPVQIALPLPEKKVAAKPKQQPGPKPVVLQSMPPGGLGGCNFIVQEIAEYVVGGEKELRRAMRDFGLVSETGFPTTKGRGLVTRKSPNGHLWKVVELLRFISGKSV